MSPEDAFRRVLADRLPSGPGWTAWIDGTVHELTAATPQGIDRDALIELLSSFDLDTADEEEAADRILALLQPVEAS